MGRFNFSKKDWRKWLLDYLDYLQRFVVLIFKKMFARRWSSSLDLYSGWRQRKLKFWWKWSILLFYCIYMINSHPFYPCRHLQRGFIFLHSFPHLIFSFRLGLPYSSYLSLPCRFLKSAHLPFYIYFAFHSFTINSKLSASYSSSFLDLILMATSSLIEIDGAFYSFKSSFYLLIYLRYVSIS